jgi:acyl dehydratase
LRVPGGRPSAVVIAAFAAILILSLAGPSVSAAKAPPGLARFMYAMGKVESGGRYNARNPYSGAYGKYQIMPSNWPAWAKTYLGNSKAKQTPANQEKVAAGKFTSLYRSLDSWRRVAYWWLTGSKRTSGWSSTAKHYVARVMRLYAKAGGKSGPDPAPVKRVHYSEKNSAIAYTGTWKTAAYGGYAGGHMLYGGEMIIVPLDRPGLKEPVWEKIEVGEELGPLEIAISDHDVKSYAYAVDDFHPWYLQDSPFGGRVAPATLLAVALLNLLHLSYDSRALRGLHAREEIELFGPVRLGQPVTLQARIADKFVKRGEQYIVVAARATDADGKTLIRTRQTEILRREVGLVAGRRSAAPSDEGVTGAIASGAPVAGLASRDAEIGAILPTLTKPVTFEQMTVFSFGPCSIHTDRDAAAESGLPGPIAQGLMSTCYLSQMLVCFFGAAWFESGWTSHAFINPVVVGDTLAVHGRIREKRAEARGTRLVLEVWCRNQSGELTTVGSASALVLE